MPENNNSIIVTLIHGTFAKNAPWVQDDSEFREDLKKKLGGNITFKALDWTGGNSNKARKNAAKDLVPMLKEQLKFPDRKKYIIAHSHGGNIALYALNELGEDAAQFHLVTMGTPFLNKKVRSFENLDTLRNLHGFFLIVLWLCLYFIIFGALFWLASRIYGRINDTYVTIGFVALALVYLPLTWRYFSKRFRLFFDNIPRNARDNYLEFAIDNISRDINHFIVYDFKDEVKNHFKRLLKLWTGVFFVTQGIIRFNRVFALTLFSLFIILAGISVIVQIIYDKKASDHLFDVSYPYFAYSILVFLISAVVLLTVPLLLVIFKSNIATLGRENFSHMLFIETTPGTVPAVRLRDQVRPYKITKHSLFSLHHSIYENQKVREDICNWIQETKAR